jgi:DNA-binding LacI/PurR family transcriptional regulator
MPGTRQDRVNLKSLARQLGVSAMTISNAFNRPEELSADLRQRILKAATRSGYHGPRPAGRLLRTGRAGAIALFNPDPIPHLFEDSAAAEFMAGISEVCERHQLGLTVLPPIRNGHRITAIESAVVDGFILYAIPDRTAIVQRVLDRRLPTVTVDMSRIDGVPAVGIDDRSAAHQLAQHVLQHGHRKLAILSLQLMPDGFNGRVTAERLKRCRSPVTRQRLRGYSGALQEAGIELSKALIYEIRTNDDRESYQWAHKFLGNKSRRPTAILAMSDRMAIGALRAARQIGLGVPEELSIVGFDDIPQASTSSPALTTIRQPFRQKGVLAAALLTGEAGNSAAASALPTELIVRESVSDVRRSR